MNLLRTYLKNPRSEYYPCTFKMKHSKVILNFHFPSSKQSSESVNSGIQRILIFAIPEIDHGQCLKLHKSWQSFPLATSTKKIKYTAQYSLIIFSKYFRLLFGFRER
jgi:hypothetical protein